MSGIKNKTMMELWESGDISTRDLFREIERLRAEVEKVRGYEVAPLEAKVSELRAEADALRVDAERYRWLRNPDQDVSLVLDKVTGYVEYHEGTQTGGYNTYEYRAGDELDSAIDAAMGASA